MWLIAHHTYQKQIMICIINAIKNTIFALLLYRHIHRKNIDDHKYKNALFVSLTIILSDFSLTNTITPLMVKMLKIHLSVQRKL